MVPVTKVEFKRLLDAVEIRSPFGRRDYCLLLLAFHMGLRVSELAALNCGNVFHNGQAREVLHVVSVIAKGGHQRIVPLNATARAAVTKLVQFNRERGFSTAAAAPLFQKRDHTRISVRLIERMVKTLRETAGLDVQATPHSMRHAFAGEVTRACGGNLRITQKLLGHARLNTVAVYTSVTRDELAHAVNRLG